MQIPKAIQHILSQKLWIYLKNVLEGSLNELPRLGVIQQHLESDPKFSPSLLFYIFTQDFMIIGLEH